MMNNITEGDKHNIYTYVGRVSPLELDFVPQPYTWLSGADGQRLTEAKELFIPTKWIDKIMALPYSKRKTIGESKRGRRAACYFLHRCHLAHYDESYVNGWVHLSSNFMGVLSGGRRYWSQMKKQFLKLGIIQENRSYATDEFPMCYRMTNGWEKGGDWKLVTFEDWPVISDSRPEIPYVSLDGSALATLEDLYEMRKVVPRFKTRRHQHKWNEDFSAIYEIDSPDLECFWTEEDYQIFKYRVCNFSKKYTIAKTGRLFTDGNMLPKEIRASILLCSMKTVEIDVSASQPTLLLTLYPKNSEERAKYQTLIENEDLYQVVANIVSPGMDRDDFKLRYFIPWLFGQENAFKPDIEGWFSKKFPELWAIIGRMLRKGKDVLPCHLQKIESELIWKAVNAAGVPLLSTHDGVRCRECDVDEVLAIIRGQFWDNYGIRPRVGLSDTMKKLNEFLKAQEAA